MKKDKLPISNLSCFSSRLMCCCTLALGVLSFGSDLGRAEILEYFKEYEESSTGFDEDHWDNGKWSELATIKLNQGETLEMVDGSIIRQLRLFPDNWHLYDSKHAYVRFVFKHDYLGEEIVIHHWNITPNYGKDIFIGGVNAANIPNFTTSNDITKSNLMVGPCEIKVLITNLKVRMHPNGQSSKDSHKIYTPKQKVTVRVKKSSVASSNAQAAVNKNILVFPKGSGVNELVLESSEDLVNWEKDTLGDKNTDSGNRFYRLRAVKK